MCFGGVIGLIVADGSQECLGYDQYGGFIDGTRMKPGKAWGLGFGLAGGLQVSDAHSKQDLTGPFKYAGHSIGDDGVGLDSTCLGGRRHKCGRRGRVRRRKCRVRRGYLRHRGDRVLLHLMRHLGRDVQHALLGTGNAPDPFRVDRGTGRALRGAIRPVRPPLPNRDTTGVI